jgi:hypothetical protein
MVKVSVMTFSFIYGVEHKKPAARRGTETQKLMTRRMVPVQQESSALLRSVFQRGTPSPSVRRVDTGLRPRRQAKISSCYKFRVGFPLTGQMKYGL